MDALIEQSMARPDRNGALDRATERKADLNVAVTAAERSARIVSGQAGA